MPSLSPESTASHPTLAPVKSCTNMEVVYYTGECPWDESWEILDIETNTIICSSPDEEIRHATFDMDCCFPSLENNRYQLECHVESTFQAQGNVTIKHRTLCNTQSETIPLDFLDGNLYLQPSFGKNFSQISLVSKIGYLSIATKFYLL